MDQRGWPVWAQVALGVLAGVAITSAIFLVSRTPSGEPIVLDPLPTLAPILIHIDGAVANPGVYELPVDSRVQDAVKAAGGVNEDANLAGTNLVASLRDGMKIHIPSNSEPAPPMSVDDGQDQSGVRININTASVEDLMKLPGIGETRAKDIINFRNEHNGFKSIEELMNVPGIGESTFNNIKQMVCLDE
ncbi:MAG: helix-hairpin-helix domain-containing protein [Anaerolineae bacterium]|nr:helix-hairpin-helix domain-containing protein [Anaerolineae bacterium]